MSFDSSTCETWLHVQHEPKASEVAGSQRVKGVLLESSQKLELANPHTGLFQLSPGLSCLTAQGSCAEGILQGTMIHAYGPGISEEEAMGSQVQSQSGLRIK